MEAAFCALEYKVPEESQSPSEDISEEIENEEDEEKKTNSGVKGAGDIAGDIWNLELFENKSKSETSGSDANKTKRTKIIESPKPLVPKTKVHHLKPQRSLSHPSPMSKFARLPPSLLERTRRLSLKPDPESFASDTYLYIIMWACAALIFWKNITLLPLLPLPIIIYILKHFGIYLGLWQWIGTQFTTLGNTIYDWCAARYDALIPVPIRGLYKISLKINRCVKDGVRNSIDTVSSVVVILGLIVFMICASVFFAIQVKFLLFVILEFCAIFRKTVNL